MTSTPAPDDDPHPSDGTQEYIGTIWIGDEPGRHLSVWARTGGEARDKVVAEYGQGHVITLHNEADAPKPTSHGRLHRVLHYEVVIPHPPSKSELPPGTLAEVERDWHDFPNLPGKHLSWRKAGRGCSELITDSNGAVRVRREAKTPLLLQSHIFPSPGSCIFASQGRTYGWQRVGKRKFEPASRVADLVNTATNAPVLRITGIHHNGVDGTSVSLAGQRVIRFPVRGHKECALMSAMDDSGNSLVEYRGVRGTNHFNLAVEAVINPNALTVPQIELLVAVSGGLLSRYFIYRSTGG